MKVYDTTQKYLEKTWQNIEILGKKGLMKWAFSFAVSTGFTELAAFFSFTKFFCMHKMLACKVLLAFPPLLALFELPFPTQNLPCNLLPPSLPPSPAGKSGPVLVNSSTASLAPG